MFVYLTEILVLKSMVLLNFELRSEPAGLNCLSHLKIQNRSEILVSNRLTKQSFSQNLCTDLLV